MELKLPVGGGWGVRSDFKDRVGERRQMRSGEFATIIRYGSSIDIDVQFDSGYISRNKQYSSFSVGSIRNVESGKSAKGAKARPSYVGKVVTNKEGEKVKCIEYRGYYDIDVEFEDGLVLESKSARSFLSGYIIRPYEGRVKKNKNGLNTIIKEYRSPTDIDVIFDDGEVVEGVSFCRWNAGKILHPKWRENRLLDTVKCEIYSNIQDFKYKIVETKNSIDVKVLFEDGEEADARLSNAKRGRVGYPGFSNGLCKMLYERFKDVHKVYEIKGMGVFIEYTDTQDGATKIGKIQELMDMIGIKRLF